LVNWFIRGFGLQLADVTKKIYYHGLEPGSPVFSHEMIYPNLLLRLRIQSYPKFGIGMIETSEVVSSTLSGS
jgi:hypothetical protein